MRISKRECLIGIMLICVPFFVNAQPHCKKGIPCGRSCISATKTCHIGESPAPPPPAPRETLASPIRSLIDQAAAQTGEPYVFPWVASVDGSIYYKASCATATKLHPDERVYFTTEEEARLYHYVRSKAKGC